MCCKKLKQMTLHLSKPKENNKAILIEKKYHLSSRKFIIKHHFDIFRNIKDTGHCNRSICEIEKKNIN